MRKIFIYWITFLVILVAGIILAISSKSVLRREERRAEKLKESIMSEPSRPPEMITAGEKAKEEAAKEASTVGPAQPVLPSSAELPPIQNIPVQINTNSLEISIPAPSEPQLNPSQSEEASQALPAVGQ